MARVAAEPPWLAHVEFQASADPTLASRLLQYNVLLHHRTGEPVETILFLLRRAADSAGLSGTYELSRANGSLILHFRYGVVRVWELPLAEVLRGPLACCRWRP